ncbi:hypothetical protein BOTBODRAFT_33501 [Botryobasidium botryosum FD-172 SS1]|uniref:PITH domain-containing protein n=1 Tax=Botryobasidium botryosum (strain FD-172 SS1) TaxID=930990 RepID=A0A067MCJ8_BOTB1|nr:hypothetical protein BOTBODRAFT_33501 [Botryobasidium botryosum FD-172 SS1]
MSCRDEHDHDRHGEGHSHGHGHGDGDHDHDHDHGISDVQPNSLFSKIDLPNVSVLNSDHPAQNAIKPWSSRLDENTYIESDADDQLIIRIPFTGSVKIRSILIKSGPEAHTPSKISAFVNLDILDFDDAESKQPAQEFDIVQSREVGEYAVNSKFSRAQTLTLFIPSAQGADTARIYFIGILGEFTQLTEQPLISIYEANANPADHEKIKGTGGPSFDFSY